MPQQVPFAPVKTSTASGGCSRRTWAGGPCTPPAAGRGPGLIPTQRHTPAGAPAGITDTAAYPYDTAGKTPAAHPARQPTALPEAAPDAPATP